MVVSQANDVVVSLDSNMENDSQNSDDKTFAAYLVICLFYFFRQRCLALSSSPSMPQYGE